MFKLNNESRYGWLTDSNVIIQQTHAVATPRTIHRYLPNSQLKIIFNGTLNMRKISNLELLKIHKIKVFLLLTCLILLLGAYTVKIKFVDKANLNSVKKQI